MSKEFVMGARIKLSDSFSGPVSAMKQSTQQFRQTVEAGSSSVASFGHHAATAGTELHAFAMGSQAATLATRGLTGATAAAKTGILGMGGAVKGVVSLLTFKFLYDWLVKSNEQMEVFENTLTIVMKDATKAKETLAWATNFAAQTPFEIPEIVEATTKLTTYGFTAQKVLGTVGDMASVMGKPLMQAVEAVADAQTGEIERLKEFGITKDMIAKKSAELGVTAIDSKGSISDLTAFNAALFAIMEERYAGGMKSYGNLFKGLKSNIQDFVGTVGRSMGAPIFEQFKMGAASVLAWTEQFKASGGLDSLAAGAGVFASNMTAALGWVGQLFQRLSTVAALFAPYVTPVFDYLITTGIPSVVSGIAQLGDWVLMVADLFVANWGWIEPMLLGIATAAVSVGTPFLAIAAATKVWAAATAVLNAVMAVNPIFLLIMGIGLLIGSIILLAKNWDVIKAKLLEVWNSFVSFFVGVWEAIDNFVNNAVAVVLTVLSYMFPVISYAVMYIVKNWDKIRAFFIATWEAVAAAFSAVWDYIYQGVTGAVSGIVSVWNTLVAFFTGLWAAVIGVITRAITPFVAAIRAVWDGVVNFFSSIWDSVYQWGANIIDTLITGIFSAKDRLVNAFKETFGEVRRLMPFSDAKEGPFSQLTYSGGAIVTTMAAGVMGNAGVLRDAVSGAFSGVSVGVNTNQVGVVFSDVVAAANSVQKNTIGVQSNAGLLRDAVSGAFAGVGVNVGANPAGNVSGGNGRGRGDVSISLGGITINGADNRTVRDMGDEIMEFLYEQLAAAGDIAAGGDMEALV